MTYVLQHMRGSYYSCWSNLWEAHIFESDLEQAKQFGSYEEASAFRDRNMGSFNFLYSTIEEVELMNKYRVTCWVNATKEQLKEKKKTYDFLIDLPNNNDRARQKLREAYKQYPTKILKDITISVMIEETIEMLMKTVNKMYPDAILASWDQLHRRI